MGKQFFEQTIDRPFYDQQADSTWQIENHPNSITDITTLKLFKETGCALCSLAMHRGEDPLDTIAAGACRANNPKIVSWLGLTKKTSDLYAEIARNILVYDNPVVVEVPGHFVLANSFSGMVDVDADGNPYGTGATAQMIGVLDPWNGRYSTLSQVEGSYGNIIAIRK